MRSKCVRLSAVALGLFALALPSAGRLWAQEDQASTTTPIKHVVVIFQENISFDHCWHVPACDTQRRRLGVLRQSQRLYADR